VASRELTDQEKRELRDKFAAAGLSAVQISLASPGLSTLVDYPWETDSRAFAKQWAADELERARTSARRNTRYIKWGTLAAIVAAVAAVIAAVPIVVQWMKCAADAF
jgi:hypothetical protein